MIEASTGSPITYSVLWIPFEEPLLLVCNSLDSEAEAPNSPADVVPRPQRHMTPLGVQHEGGQEGYKYPHS